MKQSYSSLLTGLMLILASSATTAEENASNPLAAVNNLDFRVQYFDVDGKDRTDYFLDGAYMVNPKLKLKYELHYWDTNITGSSEDDFQAFHFKPIYFPTQGKMGDWKYKLALGAEWRGLWISTIATKASDLARIRFRSLQVWLS
jgi:hypothetical protein